MQFPLPGTYEETLAELNKIDRRTSDRGAIRSQDIEHRAALASHLKNLTRDAGRPTVRSTRDDRPSTVLRSDDITRRRPDELRATLLAQMDRILPHLSDTAKERYTAELRSDDLASANHTARYIAACGPENYRSAFMRKMSTRDLNNTGPNYTPNEAQAIARYREIMAYELRAAGEGGTFGLAVPPDVNATILETAAEQAQLSGLVRIVTTSSDTWQGIAGAAPSFSFQAEAAAVADDTPTFAQAGPISVYTARSYIPASRELEQDFGSDGLLAELTTAFGRGLADTMANKLAQGSGSGEPEGIFTAMSATTTSPAHVTVTTAGSVGYLDIRKAWAAVPTRFKPNATWVMHEDTLNKVRNENSAGSQVDVVTDRQGTTIMGRPVITSDYAPDFTGTTSGSESFCVVGDLQAAYTLVVRSPLLIERVDPRETSTGLPTFQAGFFATARLGGTVTVPTALRLLSNT